MHQEFLSLSFSVVVGVALRMNPFHLNVSFTLQSLRNLIRLSNAPIKKKGNTIPLSLENKEYN